MMCNNWLKSITEYLSKYESQKLFTTLNHTVVTWSVAVGIRLIQSHNKYINLTFFAFDDETSARSVVALRVRFDNGFGVSVALDWALRVRVEGAEGAGAGTFKFLDLARVEADGSTKPAETRQERTHATSCTAIAQLASSTAPSDCDQRYRDMTTLKKPFGPARPLRSSHPSILLPSDSGGHLFDAVRQGGWREFQ